MFHHEHEHREHARGCPADGVLHPAEHGVDRLRVVQDHGHAAREHDGEPGREEVGGTARDVRADLPLAEPGHEPDKDGGDGEKRGQLREPPAEVPPEVVLHRLVRHRVGRLEADDRVPRDHREDEQRERARGDHEDQLLPAAERLPRRGLLVRRLLEILGAEADERPRGIVLHAPGVAHDVGDGDRGEHDPEQEAQADAVPDRDVGEALGVSGSMEPGDVYKVSLPRSDLEVTVDGVQIRPSFALGSWLAFKKAGEEATVMGDLVLTAGEVNPVISKLEEGGIQITALHHHLDNLKPDVLFMHVGGEGDPVALAEALHAGLAMSKTPLGKAPEKTAAEKLLLNTAELDQIIGRQGKASGGVYHFTVARAEEVTEAGMAIPPVMGTATAINFQPIGDEKAAITGDFVMTASEVNPVIRALQEQGIQVTALHDHMLEEEPRLFFMHFWANDDAQKLARGLRAALDHMNVERG
jgi:Domain of Unknown Function (DUF1259)